ncbi:MAG: hypothetical protein KGJ98_14700 [Chloroflexota bacterium]|nr:hypothetical protein [Chloroflexota bacterium]
MTFAEVARTGLVGYTDVTYVDAPPRGAHDYVVRALLSTFTSADTGPVTIATIP